MKCFLVDITDVLHGPGLASVARETRHAPGECQPLHRRLALATLGDSHPSEVNLGQMRKLDSEKL